MKTPNEICNELFLDVLGIVYIEDLYLLWKKGSIPLLNALAEINVESADALNKYSFAYYYFNLKVELFAELIHLLNLFNNQPEL